MTKIEFKRELRDCPRNTDLQKAGEKQGLLYDFAVMIDGERRGTFAKIGYGRGYDLMDADREPIREKEDTWGRMGIKAESQDRFQMWIEKALAAERIPTLAEIAKRKAEKARKAAKAKAAKLAELQKRQIQSLGPRMLDVLKAIAKEAASADTSATLRTISEQSFRAVRAVIALAEQPIKEEDDV